MCITFRRLEPSVTNALRQPRPRRSTVPFAILLVHNTERARFVLTMVTLLHSRILVPIRSRHLRRISPGFHCPEPGTSNVEDGPSGRALPECPPVFGCSSTRNRYEVYDGPERENQVPTRRLLDLPRNITGFLMVTLHDQARYRIGAETGLAHPKSPDETVSFIHMMKRTSKISCRELPEISLPTVSQNNQTWFHSNASSLILPRVFF